MHIFSFESQAEVMYDEVRYTRIRYSEQRVQWFVGVGVHAREVAPHVQAELEAEFQKLLSAL